MHNEAGLDFSLDVLYIVLRNVRCVRCIGVARILSGVHFFCTKKVDDLF